MRAGTRWGFIVIGIVVVLVVTFLGFGFVAHYETAKRLDIGYGETTSTKLINLQIGDKSFAIPQNYIWSRDRWGGGKATGVNLHAVLPNFDGYTDVNKHLFKQPGNEAILTLLVLAKGMPGLNPKSGITREQFYNTNVIYNGKVERQEQGPAGLTRVYIADAKTMHGDKVIGDISVHQFHDIYFTEKPDGEFYWVKCTPEGKAPFPSCSTTLFYSDKTKVEYRFSKKRLAEWQTIEAGVMNLIQQFEINAIK